jgi:DNA polymerase I-like protein with 3'-5' exonuclease and polymerase domains
MIIYVVHTRSQNMFQVHDELVFDVHKSGIRKNKPILKHQKWKMPLKWKLVDVFKTMLD